MDIKSLRLFLGILKYGSITKAAEHLHIAQPALGIHLRKLEEELGAQLVQRHSRGVTATEAGLLLAEHAEILVRQFTRAKQELMDYATTARGRVSVGLTSSTIQEMSADLLTEMRENFPQVTLTLTESLSDMLVELLLTNRIDLALTYCQYDSDEVDFEPLATAGIYLAYPPEEIGHRPATIPFEDVLDLPLILPSESYAFRRLAEEAAARIGKPLRVVVEIDSAVPARDLVRAGFGYALKPLGSMRWEVEQGLLGASEVSGMPVERTLYLATLTDRPVTKAFEATRAILREVVARAASNNRGWRLRPEQTTVKAA